MASKKTIAPGERVAFTFTEEDHAFIFAETLIDDDLTEPLRAATSRGRTRSWWRATFAKRSKR
ncbi:hypothetical protein Pla163_08470 [Planctomycetes bacterium Pla163]|uniref:Uncharacterized protein n=1 Tax=Rohdeia mirabilis TaxID=2528008 RepID=A0A518CX02_9BACT|nr:hypothetical protein Pla163_08470 [Planctomycetes bacterium Pla163]